MKSIKVEDQEMLVDDNIYEAMNSYKWKKLKRYKTIISIIRYERITSKIYRTIYAHRQAADLYNLISPTPNSKTLVITRDGDMWNLTKDNLIVGGIEVGRRNRKSWGGTSKYKGVSVYVRRGDGQISWLSVINSGGKRLLLGTFSSEESAALAYNEEARKLGWTEAGLNKVGER